MERTVDEESGRGRENDEQLFQQKDQHDSQRTNLEEVH